MKHLALSSLTALLLAACAVGPDYQRPTLETPASWRSGKALPANEPPETLANLAWWTLIEDPVLDGLVAEGWKILGGRKHYKVRSPGGHTLSLSNSPSCPYMLKHVEADVRRIKRMEET